MPAREPYDRQVVFDHVQLCAARHGRVRLELAGQTIWVRSGEAGNQLCEECLRALRATSYTLGAQTLCDRCVRKAVRRDRIATGRRVRSWWRRQMVVAS